MRELLYPKRYGTVRKRRVEDGAVLLDVLMDDGERIELRHTWRRGRWASDAMAKDARVKVFQKPCAPHPSFARVGR